jgi:hypothetical protein
MEARRNRRRRLLRVKIRRTDDRHGIDPAFRDHLLMAFEAGERPAGGQLEFLRERFDRGVEIVGHSGDLVATVLGKEPGEPRSAFATANEAEADLAVGRGALRDRETGRRERGESQPGAGDELTAGKIGGGLMAHVKGWVELKRQLPAVLTS